MGARPTLEELFQRHHPFVWRVVRRLGVPPAHVDDVVQEVFMVLHRRLDAFDLTGSHRGLLYGITRRVAKRRRDQHARRAHVERPVPATLPDSSNVEAHLVLRRKAEVVRDALDGMDEAKRMTFLLADVEGMTMPEVAECLGVNVNTAYARLRAARAKIQQAVARHLAREEGDDVRARVR